MTDSRPWTRSKVRRLLKDPRVWGAVRLYGREDLSKKELQRRIDKGLEERIFLDLLPLVLPKDEVDGVLAARSSRTFEGAGSGIKGQTWNIAQTLTRCGCGATATLGITYSSSRKGPDGKPLRLRYARCSAKCGAKGYRLDHLNGHLLARLQRGQLQQLLAGDGRDDRIKHEEQAIAKLQGQMALAEQQLENASRLFKDSLKTGMIDALFQEAVNEARGELESKKTAVTAAQQRLAGLRHEVDSKEFQAALNELFQAFANDQDTPKQRQAINGLLRRAGLKVSLDRERQRVGMSIGDGPIDWQPLDALSVEMALTGYTPGIRFMAHTITDELISWNELTGRQ